VSDGDADSARDRFLEALGALGPALLGALSALEAARRRLHPPALRALRQSLGAPRDRLEEALACFRAAPAPGELGEFAQELARSAELALRAFQLLIDPGPPAEAIARVLEAMRFDCRAQEALFPLRRVLPPVDRFFLERGVPEPPPPARGARVGIFHASNEPEERGGFSLFVPESWDGGEALPLVVALHGGSGHGRDFLWTWLREARSRRCLLLAPTSRGSTWSLHAPELDAANLHAMVEYVAENWSLDRERVLVTGLSDGATFALLCGLAADAPYTALAPVSGVLHPANFASGNLERARGRRIYLVHGALDWMFPVALARAAHQELARAGADVVYREIGDLSHTYPREENARILDWLLA
jgi:phospholipase/carboxylesterase